MRRMHVLVLLLPLAVAQNSRQQCGAEILSNLRNLTSKHEQWGQSIDSLSTKVTKVDADLQKAKDQSDQLESKLLASFNFQNELKNLMIEQFSVVRSQLALMQGSAEKNAFCVEWKTKLRVLVQQLPTGAYYFGMNRKTHGDATSFCLERGMQLAHFDSARDMQVVVEASPSGDYWVGATEVTGTPGEFRWFDGSKVESDLWDGNEPSWHGPNKEACVYLSVASRHNKLRDYACTWTAMFICEVAEKYLGCL